MDWRAPPRALPRAAAAAAAGPPPTASPAPPHPPPRAPLLLSPPRCRPVTPRPSRAPPGRPARSRRTAAAAALRRGAAVYWGGRAANARAKGSVSCVASARQCLCGQREAASVHTAVCTAVCSPAARQSGRVRGRAVSTAAAASRAVDPSRLAQPTQCAAAVRSAGGEGFRVLGWRGQRRWRPAGGEGVCAERPRKREVKAQRRTTPRAHNHHHEGISRARTFLLSDRNTPDPEGIVAAVSRRTVWRRGRRAVAVKAESGDRGVRPRRRRPLAEDPPALICYRRRRRSARPASRPGRGARRPRSARRRRNRRGPGPAAHRMSQ